MISHHIANIDNHQVKKLLSINIVQYHHIIIPLYGMYTIDIIDTLFTKKIINKNLFDNVSIKFECNSWLNAPIVTIKDEFERWELYLSNDTRII